MEQHKTLKAAEDNLSVSVMDANKLIKSEFEKMNKIDKFIAEGNQKYLLTGNLNPAKLLEETKQKLYIIEYEYSRILSGGDDTHALITPRPQESFIIKSTQEQQTYMYFKIPVHGQLAPAKLYIKYEEGHYVPAPENQRLRSKARVSIAGKTKVELTAYYSTTNKEPSKEACDKVIESPSCIMLTSPLKDKFEGNAVYISLLSYTGCKVQMRVKFQE